MPVFNPQDLLEPDIFEKKGGIGDRINFAWSVFNDAGLGDEHAQLQKQAALEFLKKTYQTDSLAEIEAKIKVMHEYLQGNTQALLEAFKEVNDRAVDYLPEQGPLAKSAYTFQYEDLVRHLMSGEQFESVDSPQGQIIHINNGMSYNLSDILAHANLSHLTFNEKDFARYERYCQNTSQVKPEVLDANHSPLYPTDEFFKQADKTNLFTEMNYAQKLAINIYTTNYYSELNPFMRGYYDHSEHSLDEQRDVIIHAALLGNALAKNNNSSIEATYRYEGVYDEASLQRRIDICKQGGAEIIKGFISSATKPASGFKNKVGILYTNLQGKFVAPLSRFPQEREFLIPPTQVTYTHHVFDGSTHLFNASTLIDLSLIQEKAKIIANSAQIVMSKLSEIQAHLQTLRSLVWDGKTDKDYSRQLEMISSWQQRHFNNFVMAIDESSSSSLLKLTDDILADLPNLSRAICFDYLKQFENYNLGFNDAKIDTIVALRTLQIDNMRDWEEVATIKKGLEADLEGVKQEVLTRELFSNVFNCLKDILKHQFGPNDAQMNAFYMGQLNRANELVRNNDIEALSAQFQDLTKTLDLLNKDEESRYLKELIQSYRQEKGFRMNDKADRIENSIANVPVHERSKIHEGSGAGFEVLKALASHRLRLTNGAVYLQDGKINEKKAASAFTFFKSKFDNNKQAPEQEVANKVEQKSP